MTPFDKPSCEEIAYEVVYPWNIAMPDYTNHALATCLDCHLTDASPCFKKTVGGLIEWECPACKSDDVDIFQPEYMFEEEENY